MKYHKFNLRDDIAKVYRTFNWEVAIVNTSYAFADEIMPFIEKYCEDKKK